jgi:hypothetical protein
MLLQFRNFWHAHKWVFAVIRRKYTEKSKISADKHRRNTRLATEILVKRAEFYASLRKQSIPEVSPPPKRRALTLYPGRFLSAQNTPKSDAIVNLGKERFKMERVRKRIISRPIKMSETFSTPRQESPKAAPIPTLPTSTKSAINML